MNRKEVIVDTFKARSNGLLGRMQSHAQVAL